MENKVFIQAEIGENTMPALIVVRGLAYMPTGRRFSIEA
jgi:hypothetical protein